MIRPLKREEPAEDLLWPSEWTSRDVSVSRWKKADEKTEGCRSCGTRFIVNVLKAKSP